jgi:hypothetical protein
MPVFIVMTLLAILIPAVRRSISWRPRFETTRAAASG